MRRRTARPGQRGPRPQRLLRAGQGRRNTRAHSRPRQLTYAFTRRACLRRGQEAAVTDELRSVAVGRTLENGSSATGAMQRTDFQMPAEPMARCIDCVLWRCQGAAVGDRQVMAASVNPRKGQEVDGHPDDMPMRRTRRGPPHGGFTARRAGFSGRAARTVWLSNLSLLGDFQGIVHLDAKVADCRLKFAVAKQQLQHAGSLSVDR